MLTREHSRNFQSVINIRKGFTIVELLIVIVVIAILAAISIVAYNGIQERARNSAILSAVSQLNKRLELYRAETGSYPATGSSLGSGALSDINCPYPGATSTTNWVPGFDRLPQGDFASMGAGGTGGCYLYISDGNTYVLSAWNALKSPKVTELYRRLGFRERNVSTQLYLCKYDSHPIGGVTSGVYNAANDIYKHSMTITNITNCNETPPNGA